MEVQKYIDRAYKNACEHGFHDRELSDEHCLMLIICEIAEAVEADRKGKRMDADFMGVWEVLQDTIDSSQSDLRYKMWVEQHYIEIIKGTVDEELADICIRLFDFAGAKGYKIERTDEGVTKNILDGMFSTTPFAENAFELCKSITSSPVNLVTIQACILFVELWAKSLDIDLEWQIEQKMKYNESRPKMHGKKY